MQQGGKITGIKRLRDGEYVFTDRQGYTQYHSSYATASQAMRQSDATYRKKAKVAQRPPPTIQVVQYAPRTIGGQVTSERKYFDKGVATGAIQDVTVNWGNALIMKDPSPGGCLFSPEQGNDISNREGRNVYVYNIRLNGTIRVAPVDGLAVGTAPPTVRIILCMDKQTNGVQMAPGLLITSAGIGNHINDFQSTANFGRFQILKDLLIGTATPQGVGAGTLATFSTLGVVIPFKITHKFSSPLRVNFNASNNGNVADIVDNSFHLLAASDNTTPCTLTYQCRTSFVG